MMKLTRPLILASQSPRRQTILREAGFEFKTIELNIKEVIPEDIPPYKVAKHLAQVKGNAGLAYIEDDILITADTIVICDDHLMGKPDNEYEAINMLKILSGKWNDVITGVSINTKQDHVVFDDITRVYFKPLTGDEIEHYVRQFYPLDKAGAYGIQDWIGMIGIEKIEGSYFNVVGLPIHKVYNSLKPWINYSPERF